MHWLVGSSSFSKAQGRCETGSWSQYANTLQPAAKKRYKAKLEYDDGAGSLPDPYFVKNGWQKDPRVCGLI